MGKPENSISKIKDNSGVVHEIVPHQLTDGTYAVTLPTIDSDTTVAVYNGTPHFEYVTIYDDNNA